MRAKTVDFERGKKDPKKVMGIGRPPTLQERIDEVFQEYLTKFSDTGEIELNWEHDMPSPMGPDYVDSYLKAYVPCKDKATRKKIKDMVEEPNTAGPDFKFWDEVFDIIEEEGYTLLNFNAYMKGIPRHGVKIHLLIGE